MRLDPGPRHWPRGGAERADIHVCRPNIQTSIPSYIVIHACTNTYCHSHVHVLLILSWSSPVYLVCDALVGCFVLYM